METSPGLVRAFQAVASLVALFVFIQAVLAGRFITQNEPDLTDVHRFVGYSLFLAAAFQLALAWLTRDAWRYRMVIWSAVSLLLMVVQTALGDLNRSDPEPELVAVHIPLGVFLFSLTSIIAMLSAMDEKAKTVLRGTG